MIRDCIVVEISNTLLSQKLMQDDRLTLDKAVKEAWSSELVKEQQKILKADENGKLREKSKSHYSRMKSRPKPRNMKEIERLKEQKPHRKFSAKTCYCCGKSPLHKHDKYSAAKATCLKCSKQGNYATVCKCKVVHAVEEEI